MKALPLFLVASCTLFLGACATTTKPTYVSPTQFQALNCQQLQAEYNRIQQHLDNGVQPAKRTGMGVGVGLGGGWGRGGWGFGPSISVNMGQSSNTKKTEVSKIDIPKDEILGNDEKYSLNHNIDDRESFVRLKFLEFTNQDNLSLQNLQENGLKQAPQSKITIKDDLLKYILKNPKLLEDELSTKIEIEESKKN